MLVYASGQCMEQRSCGCSQLWHSAPPEMAVGCCELRLRSTPRYRLVCNCFPDPGRGLPSKCLGPGECLYSFIHHAGKLAIGCDHIGFVCLLTTQPATKECMDLDFEIF